MKPQIIKNKGKGSREQDLPSRFAMQTLTKGDPVQRSMQQYAKEAPGLDQGTPNIFGVGDTLP